MGKEPRLQKWLASTGVTLEPQGLEVAEATAQLRARLGVVGVGGNNAVQEQSAIGRYIILGFRPASSKIETSSTPNYKLLSIPQSLIAHHMAAQLMALRQSSSARARDGFVKYAFMPSISSSSIAAHPSPTTSRAI